MTITRLAAVVAAMLLAQAANASAQSLRAFDPNEARWAYADPLDPLVATAKLKPALRSDVIDRNGRLVWIEDWPEAETYETYLREYQVYFADQARSERKRSKGTSFARVARNISAGLDLADQGLGVVERAAEVKAYMNLLAQPR